jgi:uncharacterized membrane protein YhaH (DUF805 family)
MYEYTHFTNRQRVGFWVFFLIISALFIAYSVLTVPTIVEGMQKTYSIPSYQKAALPKTWMYFVSLVVSLIPAFAVLLVLNKGFTPFSTEFGARDKPFSPKVSGPSAFSSRTLQ